jgi:SAM-dependent methyltransferase
MAEMDCGSKYWDAIYREATRHHLFGLVAEAKKYGYLNILKEWEIALSSRKILVTDLFDEAFQLNNLFYLSSQSSSKAVGMDISSVIVKKTKNNLGTRNILVCDVRALPFKKGCFDIVLSPSSLDHFPKNHLISSLNEISRVLKSGGKAVVTLHNKSNIFLHFYVIRLLNKAKFKFYTYAVRDFEETAKKTNLAISRHTAICHLPLPLITRHVYNRLSKINALRNFLTKVYMLFERLEGTRLNSLTGELLVFELAKKVHE